MERVPRDTDLSKNMARALAEAMVSCREREGPNETEAEALESYRSATEKAGHLILALLNEIDDLKGRLKTN